MSSLKLWNSIYCPSRRQREVTEGFKETTGDHRGQFPRTDFCLARESSPLPTPPRTPKAMLVTILLGDDFFENMFFEHSTRMKCNLVF